MSAHRELSHSFVRELVQLLGLLAEALRDGTITFAEIVAIVSAVVAVVRALTDRHDDSGPPKV